MNARMIFRLSIDKLRFVLDESSDAKDTNSVAHQVEGILKYILSKYPNQK